MVGFAFSTLSLFGVSPPFVERYIACLNGLMRWGRTLLRSEEEE